MSTDDAGKMGNYDIKFFLSFYLCLLTSILTGSTELRDNEKSQIKKKIKLVRVSAAGTQVKVSAKRLGNEEMS